MPTATIAKADLLTAINTANALTLPILSAGDLGGRTLVPGLYKSTSSLAVTGALTLDAQGNPNAVWVFQMASTLTTLTAGQIILTGGAQASNVFWIVGSSATLGTTSVFKGTIMANASITITTGAELDGRALAKIAAVTMDTNTIRPV
ncbi:MAG TPA: ice-binding family protein [Candidatus Bathyarchaeia archaeon]|nr:ice-binding family protein [Candidatus Bathyarchaeia archaeon]